MHRTYIFIVLLSLSCMVLLFAMNALFLLSSGEFSSVAALAERQLQQKEFCLYGTALHADDLEYKQEMFGRTKPSIVAIGSSRSMQYREKFFRGSFYNMGMGKITSLPQLQDQVEKMLAKHVPDFVILSFDFWWFNPKYELLPPPKGLPAPRFSSRGLLTPFSWISDGKITLKEYAATILQGMTDGSGCFLGVQALIDEQGYASDGSYYYAGTVTGHADDVSDVGFGATLAEVSESNGHLLPGDEIDPGRIPLVLDLVELLRSRGVTVVVTFPPVAPPVFEAMEKSHNYAYITALWKALAEAGIPTVNTIDPRTIDADKCEFIDGIHGGEVVAARMLGRIVREQPALGKFIDSAKIADSVSQNTGLAMIPDARVTTAPEQDFLELGCNKANVDPSRK